MTAAVGYAFTHFYGTDFSGASFIGSSQTSAQVGYNRSLTSHTQVALVYGYQGFDFSVLGTAFHSHVIQGMYGHRITGRMDLLLGAGPQITLIDTQSAVCSDPTIQPILCTLFGDTLNPDHGEEHKGWSGGTGAPALQVSENNHGAVVSAIRNQRVRIICRSAK